MVDHSISNQMPIFVYVLMVHGSILTLIIITARISHICAYDSGYVPFVLLWACLVTYFIKTMRDLVVCMVGCVYSLIQ